MRLVCYKLTGIAELIDCFALIPNRNTCAALLSRHACQIGPARSPHASAFLGYTARLHAIRRDKRLSPSQNTFPDQTATRKQRSELAGGKQSNVIQVVIEQVLP